MPLSVRDVVDRLTQTGTDDALLQERIRHWTRERLLDLAGEANPGTGRKRLYSNDTVHEAAILNQLADMGLGIKQMHHAMSAYRSRTKRVRDALAASADKSTVLLTLNIDRRGWAGGWIVLPPAANTQNWEEIRPAFVDTDSNIIINLTRLFAEL